MFLIVGLGNPGAEYAKTRHNVGFMVADAVHDKYGFAPYKAKFDGLISEGKIDGEKVYLLKPQTYMNLSGNSVVKAAAFYKILPQNIVVIHDDMDLKITQIKAKLGGGAAIKIMDHSVLCHREVVARLRQLAAEKKIPAQDDLLKVGGTDAGVIHVSRGGVRTGGVSIPCRYTHSQTELIDLADLEACVKLVQAYCESEFE